MKSSVGKGAEAGQDVDAQGVKSREQFFVLVMLSIL